MNELFDVSVSMGMFYNWTEMNSLYKLLNKEE